VLFAGFGVAVDLLVALVVARAAMVGDFDKMAGDQVPHAHDVRVGQPDIDVVPCPVQQENNALLQ
jgi:hypothetical protein